MADVKALSPVRITQVNSLDDLRPYRTAYEALLRAVPGGRGISYSPEWIAALAPAFFSDSRRLFFLLAWRGDRLAGVAPFVIEQKPLTRARVRRVYFWGDVPGSLLIEGDFLIPESADIEPCVDAFFRYLTDPGSVVDYLDLGYLREDSNVWESVVRRFGAAHRQQESMASHYVDLPGDFECYVATRTKTLRSRVGNRSRALERAHRCELRCSVRLTAAELEEVMALHVRRQSELVSRGRPRHSLFEIPAERRAFLGVLEASATSGAGRHYLLLADGRIIAFALCFHYSRVLIWRLIAFDSAFGKYEPGRVLLWKIIEAEIASGQTDRIDLLPGTTRTKTDLSTSTQHRWRLTMRKPGSIRSGFKVLVWKVLVAAAQVWRLRPWAAA